MEGRDTFDLNRGAVFTDLVNFRHILDSYRRYGAKELLDDVFAWIADPANLGIDRVTCHYLFGTYANAHRPEYAEMRMRRRFQRGLSARQWRPQNYSLQGPYGWADIEQSVRASSGEWDVAILLSSSHDAFELAYRISQDQIPGLWGKEAIVLYSQTSASTLYTAGQVEHNGVALETIFPAWNAIYATTLRPVMH